MTMIIWKKTDYGFHFTLSSPITIDQTKRWSKQVKEVILQLDREFVVFVDLRDCELMPNDSKPVLEELQTFCRQNGLQRSVVILSDRLTAMQFQIIAKKTGIYDWERYIDSSMNPDWEQSGMNWILYAIDPDSNVKQSATCSDHI